MCFRYFPFLVNDTSDHDLTLDIAFFRIAFELLLEEAIKTCITPFELGWFDGVLRRLAAFNPWEAKIKDLGFG